MAHPALNRLPRPLGARRALVWGALLASGATLLACGGPEGEARTGAASSPAPPVVGPPPPDHAALVAAATGDARPDAARWLLGGPDAGERAPHQSLAVSPTGGAVAWATRDGRLRWVAADGTVRLDAPGPAGCEPVRSCPWLVVGFVDEVTLAVVRHGPAVEGTTLERWTVDGRSASVPLAEVPVAPWSGQPWHLALRPQQHEGRTRLLVDGTGRAWELGDPDPARRMDAWTTGAAGLAWSDWDGGLWLDATPGAAGPTGERMQLDPAPVGMAARIREMSQSPDGARLVVLDDSGMLQVFDAATGDRLQAGRWPDPPERVAAVDAGHALGLSVGAVSCLDLAERRVIGSWSAPGVRPREARVAGDRAYVPTAGVEGVLVVDLPRLCAPPR